MGVQLVSVSVCNPMQSFPPKGNFCNQLAELGHVTVQARVPRLQGAVSHV